MAVIAEMMGVNKTEILKQTEITKVQGDAIKLSAIT